VHERMVVGSGLIQHAHSVSKHGLQMVKLESPARSKLAPGVWTCLRSLVLVC